MPEVAQQAIAFPVKAVEEALLGALAQVVLDQIQVSQGGISDASEINLSPAIDSLVAVEILCDLDEILMIQLTECIVRPGGYDTVEEAVKHLAAGARREWDKRNKQEE